MAEEKTAAEQLTAATNKKHLKAGIAAVIILLAAGALLWLRSAAPSSMQKLPAEISGIGTVNLTKVLQAHSEGTKLADLRAEQAAKENELRGLKQQLLHLMTPQLDKKTFQDAARQKTTQKILQENSDFLAELDRQEKVRREETRPEYEKARDEINELFLLEIFNIRLKLDNADSLKLSEESVKLLEEKLQDLQHQRGERQISLWKKYEQSIRDWKEAEAAKKGLDISYQWKELEGQNLSAELKKRSEAQNRNLQAMQQNMKQRVELRQLIVAKQRELQAQKAAADALEKEIMQFIAGKAAKLAMLHHLDVIIADKTENRRLTQDAPFLFTDIPVQYQKVINVKAVDLTEELCKEIRNAN